MKLTNLRAKPITREGNTSPRTFVYWILLAVSLLVVITSVQNYLSAKAVLQEERQSLAECQSIAEQLQTLAARPKLASVENSANESSAKQINVAIQKAGIASSNLRSVSPSPTMRLGSSDYQQRETSITLSDVSLTQIVLFEQALNAGLGITLSELTLSIPEKTGSPTPASEVWDARLTLTQIIYSPKSPK